MSVSLYGSGQTVIQVVSAVNTTPVSTTSTTLVSSGFSASITPQSTTSKVLINAVLHNCYNPGPGAVYLSVFRGATNLATTGSPATLGIWYTATAGQGTVAFTFLDSPSTTSSTTYTIYIAGSGGTNAQFSNSSLTSTLTLQEVSGS
jgi:hypothetical protein